MSLALLLLALPLLARYLLGWSGVRGFVSDLAIGGLLLLLLRGRPVWLVVPVLGFWALLYQGTAELVSAMTRMPEARDLYFLADIPFLYRSTGGSGINHPWLALFLSLGVVLYPLSSRASRPIPARMQSYLFAALLVLLTGHAALSRYAPSEADEWKQINYPHKLLAKGVQAGRQLLDNWLPEDPVDETLDITGLSRLDLDGTRFVPGSGRARNVLIVALEGVPGAYIARNRRALHSPFAENPMPKLSRWAERAMTTPDYVLHSHQTMRGLYAMLCGDYSKLDTGMPKVFELLNSNTDRNRQCLPAQLRDRGFTTHFLQGAGLQFMSKDKIMPHIGFTRSHGREWFRNKPVVDFSWGMDDQSFFAGALDYVNQLRAQRQPWMLTLLTVGTHQPYAVPEDYLARYPNPKQAAIGFLDDAVDGFLSGLDEQGVLDDTLVVLTSDESHGIEGVRLASAWGFNLVFAPEQAALPGLKPGVYGHVDLTASVLDYFAYPVPSNLSGRSLFRSYDSGREMMSYTNGLLRHHDGKGTFVECDFRHVCRRYASAGFLSGSARYLGRFAGREAKLVAQRAEVLDQSILSGQFGRPYRFANRDRVKLQEKVGDDWTSNLIGAQYLALPQASQTTVHLRVRALKLPGKRLQLRLKLKEFDQDIDLGVPTIPALTLSRPIDLSFSFDNPQARKAFSFHLLGQGRGLIEIIEFSVISQPLRRAVVAS